MTYQWALRTCAPEHGVARDGQARLHRAIEPEICPLLQNQSCDPQVRLNSQIDLCRALRMLQNSDGASVFSRRLEKSGITVFIHGLTALTWQLLVDTVSPERLQVTHHDKHHPAHSARHSRHLNPSRGPVSSVHLNSIDTSMVRHPPVVLRLFYSKETTMSNIRMFTRIMISIAAAPFAAVSGYFDLDQERHRHG